MQIKLNGKAQIISDYQSLAELIRILQLNNKNNIAIAVNKQVIPLHQWKTHKLSHLDNVDIVQAIGGG